MRTIYYVLDLNLMKVIESFEGTTDHTPPAATARAAERARITKHTHMVVRACESFQGEPN